MRVQVAIAGLRLCPGGRRGARMSGTKKAPGSPGALILSLTEQSDQYE